MDASGKKSFVISAAILLLAGFGIGTVAHRKEPVVVKTHLEHLPVQISGYLGRDEAFDVSIYDELDADRHVYRHYRDPNGNQIDLYVGYYGTAKGGRTPHSPYACLPGSGWGIAKTGKVRLHPAGYPKPVRINYVLARKGDAYQTMLHWYQSAGDQVLASGIDQNLQRFVGRLLHNRSDGAFVRVSAFVPESEISAANLRLGRFAETVLRLLPDYWPEER